MYKKQKEKNKNRKKEKERRESRRKKLTYVSWCMKIVRMRYVAMTFQTLHLMNYWKHFMSQYMIPHFYPENLMI